MARVTKTNVNMQSRTRTRQRLATDESSITCSLLRNKKHSKEQPCHCDIMKLFLRNAAFSHNGLSCTFKVNFWLTCPYDRWCLCLRNDLARDEQLRSFLLARQGTEASPPVLSARPCCSCSAAESRPRPRCSLQRPSGARIYLWRRSVARSQYIYIYIANTKFPDMGVGRIFFRGGTVDFSRGG